MQNKGSFPAFFLQSVHRCRRMWISRREREPRPRSVPGRSFVNMLFPPTSGKRQVQISFQKTRRLSLLAPALSCQKCVNWQNPSSRNTENFFFLWTCGADWKKDSGSHERGVKKKGKHGQEKMILDTYANNKLQIKLLFIHRRGKTKVWRWELLTYFSFSRFIRPFILASHRSSRGSFRRLKPSLKCASLIFCLMSSTKTPSWAQKYSSFGLSLFIYLFFFALPFCFPVIPAGSISSFVIKKLMAPMLYRKTFW